MYLHIPQQIKTKRDSEIQIKLQQLHLYTRKSQLQKRNSKTITLHVVQVKMTRRLNLKYLQRRQQLHHIHED